MIATKVRIFSFGIASLVTASLFAACGGSDGSPLISGTPDDGSTSSDGTTNGGDGSTIPKDSGGPTGLDAAVDITDGGANFGDAGSDDGGDFPDGGTCNRTDLGDAIMSTCSALSAFETGGQLQNGTYTLTKVTDEGSFSFCQNTFVAVPFRGGVVISSGSGSASDIEIAIDGDASGRKSYSWTATPASGNKSPLAIDQSCPTTTSFSLPYSTQNASAFAKQSFEIIAPYGSAGGTAVYHFEKD